MKIEDIELLRTQAKKFMGFNLLFIVLFIVAIVIVKWYSIILLPFVIYFAYKSTKFGSEFKKAYKDNFVKVALGNVVNNLEYHPEYGFSKDMVDSIGMLSTGDRYSANDYFKGTYNGVNLEYSDLLIEERDTDDEGNTTYDTIFRGSLMIFDFHKSFKSDVCIRSRRITPVRNKYVKVKMEDIEFNKMFDVSALNELDAFYILTPHMMDRIKNIVKGNKSDMLFGFDNNKLYIANYNNKNGFEPNMSKELTLENINSSINEDIIRITQFVDELNLDTNLFK